MKNYLDNRMISGRQLVAFMIIFMLGSSVVIGVSIEAAQDSWLTLLAAVIISVPVVLMYARIAKLFPQKGLYDFLELVFGKIIGKILTVFYVTYALQLGGMVVRDFSEFAQITSLTSTPQIYLMLIMMSAVTYLVLTGIENMGRSVMFPLILVIASIIITLLLSFGQLKLDNFLPVFDQSLNEYTQGTFNIVSWPIAETVLILPMFDAIKKKDSPYKIYLLGLFLGSSILLIIILRNIGALGPHLMQDSLFPSYRTARLLQAGDIFERFEAIVSYNFIFTGIGKIAVCLYAASKGIAKLFGLSSHRQIIIPTSLLIIALGPVVFKDPLEIIEVYNVTPYFFLPVQIIIPAALWIGSEIKMRKRNRRVA